MYEPCQSGEHLDCIGREVADTQPYDLAPKCDCPCHPFVTALRTIAATPLDGDELPDGDEFEYAGNDDEHDAFIEAIGLAREVVTNG